MKQEKQFSDVMQESIMRVQRRIDEATDDMIFQAIGNFTGIGDDRRTITEYLSAGNVRNFRLEKNALGIHLFFIPTGQLLGHVRVEFGDYEIKVTVSVQEAAK